MSNIYQPARCSNVGRPPAGMEFVELDQAKRYRTRNFEMRPTKFAEELFQRHDGGETIRELAAELNMPETNMKRLLRNVRQYYDNLQDEYLRRVKLDLE